MLPALTARQAAVLAFVRSSRRVPSIREVADHFGVFYSAARGHLLALQRKGAIVRGQGSRAIGVVGGRFRLAGKTDATGRIEFRIN